jgi:hypothetical protein
MARPYAFDTPAGDGEDLRKLPLSMRKANVERLLARRPDGIFVDPFEQGEIGPACFARSAILGSKICCPNIQSAPLQTLGRCL